MVARHPPIRLPGLPYTYRSGCQTPTDHDQVARHPSIRLPDTRCLASTIRLPDTHRSGCRTPVVWRSGCQTPIDQVVGHPLFGEGNSNRRQSHEVWVMEPRAITSYAVDTNRPQQQVRPQSWHPLRCMSFGLSMPLVIGKKTRARASECATS
jgi:hypothetical protein